MNKILKTTFLLTIFAFNVSCSDRGPIDMNRYLEGTGNFVSEEMKDSVADSAYQCGFKHIMRNVRET